MKLEMKIHFHFVKTHTLFHSKDTYLYSNTQSFPFIVTLIREAKEIVDMRLFVPLFMFACGDEVKIAEPSTEEGEFFVDEDGDGYLADDDCDDNDASIFPNAEELCDGFDNNW